MEREGLKGKAQTVLGLIDGKDLGIVLPHEHLFFDVRFYFVEPNDLDGKNLAYQPVSLENLGWVRYHRTNSLDNFRLTDEDITIKEASLFKKAGGNTIVDVTPNNIGRNPAGLVHVAKATGLNIIMGTGYYVERSYRTEMRMDSRTEEDIAEEFVRDITIGVGDTGVKAGIIGELGCSWPLTNNERKVLRAAAIAQQRTGASISVHPGFHPRALLEIVKILTAAGAQLTRVIFSHIEKESVSTHNSRLKLVDTGCYLEWDTFGTDGEYPPLDTPNDTGRVKQIIQLIAKGYLNRILMSQDICRKILLNSFSGGGYAHILNNVVPLMRVKGITEEQIHIITVENPRRVLALA